MLKTSIYRIESENNGSKTIIKSEGTSKNQLLIVAKVTDLIPENRKTLSDILNAIKYNLEDSTMLLLDEGQSVSINTYIHQHKIQKVICFGLSAKEIGLQIAARAYHLIEMEGLNLVFSHSINDLNADKQKKIALWKTIQGI